MIVGGMISLSRRWILEVLPHEIESALINYTAKTSLFARLLELTD